MDTQAFQHLLTLFPQLFVRQRHIAQRGCSSPVCPLPLMTCYQIALCVPIAIHNQTT